MNKTLKRFVAFLTAAIMLVSVFALAACNKTTELDAPVIELNGNVVSWEPVEHADSYDVKVGTKAAVNTTETTYTITETAEGDYEITVVAKSNDSKYSDSKPSNKKTYTVDPPAASGVAITQTSEWVAIPYADGWTVSYGDDFDWSDYFTVTDDGEPVAYELLTITATGTEYGEDKLSVKVEYDGEDETFTYDVYYGIANEEQYKKIADDLAGWYIVTEDITFETWQDMFDGQFTGHLNGNYKQLTNYKIGGDTGWDHAMFRTNDGTIEALNIQGGQAYASGRVAIIAGSNTGTIKDCFVKVSFVGGANCTAGITWGAGVVWGTEETESTTAGTVTGCVVITEVYTNEGQFTAGVVGSVPSGTVKDNLFIQTECIGGDHNHAVGNVATQAVSGAEVTCPNNAAIAEGKLAFSADGRTYYSTDAPETTYTNNFTTEIYELIQEYLRQLTDAE